MSAARKHVIVIGGGVSGLTCAYRLQQRDWNVTVLEAANRVGGFLQSASHPAGFRYEEGPEIHARDHHRAGGGCHAEV